MKPQISQMEPWLGSEERKAVNKYLQQGGWLTEFKKTKEFESAIADYTGARYAAVVPNGTLALAGALMAAGIKRGDEVIVPDYTMIASANAIVLAGATPVFVDIDPETLCLDLQLASKAVTKRTRALMLVTINGRFPAMEDAVALARKHKLFLLEDAAQSLGSFYRGRHLGTFGDAGILSFSAPKIITTGQGGAILTDSKKLYEAVLHIKDFGRQKSGVDYHEAMGYNLKFTDIQAVVGIEQFKKLSWRVARKKQIYGLYAKLLGGVKGITLIPTDLESTSPWFVDILVAKTKRKPLMEFLKREGVGTRPFYPAIHIQPPYRWVKGKFPVSEQMAGRGLWLPSSSFLKDRDIRGVAASIQKFFHE
ncbi:MAG: DegT/DnrJ/EryC1/StrS family aminotransferase [bacterium]|nr:DegT/DnrJ/EryC1/StrS family aminotransferase [bacterium]